MNKQRVAEIQEYAAKHGVELDEDQATKVSRLELAFTAMGYPGFTYHLMRVLQMDSSFTHLAIAIDGDD